MTIEQIKIPTQEHWRVHAQKGNHVNVYQGGKLEIICPNRYLSVAEAEEFKLVLERAIALAEENKFEQWS